MDPLVVQSSQGPYTVGFDRSLGELVAHLGAIQSSVVLVDRSIITHYSVPLRALLESRPVYVIEANEDEKTLEGCARALTFLQQSNASRQTQVIAIGGGIVQDIATFCTHVYYRGLQWTYVPTTLLGMADSCIGAKASINFNGFKNQLGVFHSPSGVRICEAFLATLPDEEVRSGYGEIVKLHLAGSREAFTGMARTLDAGGFRNEQLSGFVRASLLIKKAVIEVDEFDNGIRRTLNYGHTFGHALEAVTHHAVPHGLAVVWGMDLINFIGVKRGLLAQADFDAIHAVFARHYAFALPRPIGAPELLAATRRDKKIKDGRLTLVIPSTPGNLRIVSQAYTPELEGWIADYLEGPGTCFSSSQR